MVAKVPLLVMVMASVREAVATAWSGNTSDEGVMASVWLSASPVPLSAKVCGLAVVLSVIVTVSVRAPDEPGANFTLTLQVAPGLMVVEADCAHPVRMKFVVVSVTVEIVTGTLPVLVSVAVCCALVVPTAWGPNVNFVVERVRPDTPTPAPAPIILMVEFARKLLLLETDTLPERKPTCDGRNEILMVQLALGESVAGETGQLLDWKKSVGFVPPIVRLEIVSA